MFANCQLPEVKFRSWFFFALVIGLIAPGWFMDNNAAFVDKLAQLSDEGRKPDTFDASVGPIWGNNPVRTVWNKQRSTFGLMKSTSV